MADEPLTESKALDNLRAIQSVIDGRISSLDGLRKLGSSDYAQREIKSVEVGLMSLRRSLSTQVLSFIVIYM